MAQDVTWRLDCVDSFKQSKKKRQRLNRNRVSEYYYTMAVFILNTFVKIRLYQGLIECFQQVLKAAMWIGLVMRS